MKLVLWPVCTNLHIIIMSYLNKSIFYFSLQCFCFSLEVDISSMKKTLLHLSLYWNSLCIILIWIILYLFGSCRPIMFPYQQVCFLASNDLNETVFYQFLSCSLKRVQSSSDFIEQHCANLTSDKCSYKCDLTHKLNTSFVICRSSTLLELGTLLFCPH